MFLKLYVDGSIMIEMNIELNKQCCFQIQKFVCFLFFKYYLHYAIMLCRSEQLSKPGKLQPSGLNLVCRQQWRHCSQMYVSEVRVTCLRSWTYQQKWNSVHTFDKKYIIWLKTWHRLTVFWCKLLMYLFSWFHSDHLLNYNSKNCDNSIQIIHNNQKI